MTFRELQDTCLRELGYDPASLSTEPRERVKDRLNHWHRRLLTRPVLSRWMRQASSVTITSVSGTAQYAVPFSVSQIVAIRDETNDRALPCVALDTIRQADPGLTATGVSDVWALVGQRPVYGQPATAVPIYCKSTSALDTMTVHLEYLTSNHVQKRASATLTGATAVAIGSDSVLEVLGWDLSTVPAGEVTLHETSGSGTQLGSIPAGMTTTARLWIQLYPTPNSAITYNLDVVRRLTDLMRDGEEPLLPRDFQDVLSLGVLADEWRRKGDLERSALMRQDYEGRLKDLEWWVWNQPAYSPGAPSLDAPSRLGPWFPAGS